MKPGPPPIPLEEAQARLLALVTPLPIERVDIESALGLYLAEPLRARRTQPAADLSAMDGYAVRTDDLAGPWKIVGESAAGHPFAGRLSPGEAVRIATGALMPADARVVLLQEDIVREADAIRFVGQLPVPPEKHTRQCGMDFAEGQDVLAQGLRIGPAHAALALSAGHRHVPVRRRPLVAVIDSGDELAEAPEACPAHQIPASNGVMLAAMISETGARTMRLGPVADTMEAIAQAFARSAEADVIVTSGGASVGDHDLIKPALEAWGAELDFWRVAIKPGKPVLVATRDNGERRQIVVGLPGNPVSSYVTCFFFVLPVLRALLGAAAPCPSPVRGRTATPLAANGERREFRRAAWNGDSVAVQTVQDSGALSALAASNFLIDRPANAPALDVGDEIVGYLLGNGGIA